MAGRPPYRRPAPYPTQARPVVFPRPRFPRLPPSPLRPRHPSPSRFPARFPPPHPRYPPPLPRYAPPYPYEAYDYGDYGFDEYSGHYDSVSDFEPPPPPRVPRPPGHYRPRLPPAPPIDASLKKPPKIPSLLSLPEQAPPPEPERTSLLPRPRRTLVEEVPSTSQSKKSEFIIVDYGHNSANSDLSKAADLLCFDYDHGNDPKSSSPSHRSPRSGSNVDPEPGTSADDQQEQIDESEYSRTGEEFYYRLTLDAMNQYDKSYEQSIWDYDPRFTWDYLPGTGRGTDEIKEFIVGRDYYEEETKWKRHKYATEKVYSHEIAERKAKLEKGESLYNDEEEKPISVRPADFKDPIYEQFEKEIGFPEHKIQEDYCGICGVSFDSVLSSAEHYEGQRHESQVRNHFVSGLVKMGILPSHANVSKHLEDTIIKRGMGNHKTRPSQWECELCNVMMTSASMIKSHTSGVAHRKRQQIMKNMLSA